jgi:hypothetical protein
VDVYSLTDRFQNYGFSIALKLSPILFFDLILADDRAYWIAAERNTFTLSKDF